MRRAVPGLRALTVDALPYHEAGGSAAQELGCALATGVAYLRELTEAGLGTQQALSQLEFRFAATADQFLTVAKLRAARRLWARVAEVCGASQAGAQVQHAVTSPVMMTRRDPWVNMLRTTVATLAAGVGGADAVTVLPFDSAIGVPDGFARRIARNTSTILIEESHLSRVIDPAGGSWYVERLTDELAHAAWEFFRTIEREGGQAAALRSGLVRERLAETWAARSVRLAARREPVTGVSEFPYLGEKPVERVPVEAPPSGGLPRVRRDEAFEALRARSDSHLAATGGRPRVYLAALGPATAHTARLTFAANLFQAGGIEAVTDGTFEESGAQEVCLCSSDTVYEEQAEATAGTLRAAGARHVFLAVEARNVSRGRHVRLHAAVTPWPRSPPRSTAWECPDVHPFRPRLLGGRARDTGRRQPARTTGAPRSSGPPTATTCCGRPPKASPSSRSTPGRIWRASTSSTPSRASPRTCAARTRRCT